MKFEGEVIKGLSVGQKFGIATANLEVPQKPKLKEGVYLVVCQIREERSDVEADTCHFVQGLLHFGHRRTFGGDFSIEVHLLDFDRNIYEASVVVEVLDFVRPTQTFRNSDQLYSQIERDITFARKYFMRREIWSHWAGVGHQQKKAWEAHAVHHILEDSDFLNAKVVLLYAPQVHKEIDFASRLMELCPHKTYYFPRVDKKGLHFYQVDDYHHLQKGFKKILEPKATELFDPKTLGDSETIIFVPAVGVGHDHVRLGQGGGYYDRFLESLKGGTFKTMSVIPQFAYKKDLPSDPWDKHIDKLILV